MYVCVSEREKERERDRVCVKGFIVDSPLPPPHLVLRANGQVRCFTNIHLHYIIQHGEPNSKQFPDWAGCLGCTGLRAKRVKPQRVTKKESQRKNGLGETDRQRAKEEIF